MSLLIHERVSLCHTGKIQSRHFSWVTAGSMYLRLMHVAIEPNEEKSHDWMNPVIFGLMILLAVAMAIIAVIAIIAIAALIRRRTTGHSTRYFTRI